VAGLVVMTSFKVLLQQYDKIRTLYVSDKGANVRKELFTMERLAPPNPKCYVCRDKPELGLKADLDKLTIRILKEKVLQSTLNMIAPDVEIEGKGTILLSSEEGESDEIIDKLLKDFAIENGTRLVCDDFLQNYQITITIVQMKEEDKENLRNKEETVFEVVGDLTQLNPKAEEVAAASPQPSTSNGNKKASFTDNGGNEDDLKIIEEVKDEDYLEIIEPADENVSFMDTSSPPKNSKRPYEGTPAANVPVKKRRVLPQPNNTPDSDVVQLD
jgi:ubiquitin-like 1-activating enzyme E1 B